MSEESAFDDDRIDPHVHAVATQIASMEIRGAATIAGAAAGALAEQAERSTATTKAAFLAEQRAAARILYETRPTAVSLPNALRYILRGTTGETVSQLRSTTVSRATSFSKQLASAQETLGRVGSNRLRDGDRVMTHCHSTDALACLEAAVADGKEVKAVVKETRPRKQGHITARQLREAGIPVTLIVDNAARRYLDTVDHVLVGADSIAADGSVINKIGTSGLAVIARERGVPVTVAAQTIKLHPDTMTGHTVEIESRAEAEVLSAAERADIEEGTSDRETGSESQPEAPTPAGLTVENPAFDVTPPRYVDAIVTERGQFPPESIVILMRELFGETTGEPWEPDTEPETI